MTTKTLVVHITPTHLIFTYAHHFENSTVKYLVHYIPPSNQYDWITDNGVHIPTQIHHSMTVLC